MGAFRVPDDFRAFMREVAAKIDWAEPESVEHECGRGTRIQGKDAFRFTYLGKGDGKRWEIELRPQQIRDIAAGHLHEVEADELAEGSRITRGEPLLVWGEYDEDALRVRSLADLGVALDALQGMSTVEPLLVRLWSSGDDQVVVVINALECALYVVAGEHGYGTSVGDPTRGEAFTLLDHDVGSVSIPWHHCVPWRVAREALLKFAQTGAVGEHVILDGSIPSQFLMLGDFTREAELETRRTPQADPALTSLPRKAPSGEWARRLLGSLVELQLIEIDTSIQDLITARLAMLLQQFGDDAQDSPETAQQLARELGRLRGVGALFATGGDLQIALRRTQDPPTAPVEMPFT